MSTSHPDPLIAAYLRRLDTAAATLPAPRRTELIAEIRAHIDDALSDAGAADEVTVRNVLERLGAPEEIAAAAIGPRTEPVRTRGKLEVAALLALTLGGLLPVIGWLVGIVLVAAFEFWTRRDKAVGLLLGLLPALTLFAVLLISARSGGTSSMTPNAVVDESSGGPGPFEWLILTWGIVSGLPSALYLAYRLRHQRPASSGGQFAVAGAAGD